jgi:hypothetical protein
MVSSGVIAEEAANVAGILDGIVAGEAGIAAGGKKQGGEDFQESGFACAVGTEKRDSFTFLNFEGHSCESSHGGFLKWLKKRAPAAACGREKLLKRIDADCRRSHYGIYSVSWR